MTVRPPSAPGARNVRVLVVEGQAVMRRAARDLLAATPGFEQAGEARPGPEAVEAAVALRPDLVLVEVVPQGRAGITTAQHLVARLPEAAVVLISLEGPDEFPEARAATGAAAHLRKQDLSGETLTRLWRCHASLPAHHR